MAKTAQLMQCYDGPQHIAEHGREMEGAARIAHGWADGIEADGQPDVHEACTTATNKPQGPQQRAFFMERTS